MTLRSVTIAGIGPLQYDDSITPNAISTDGAINVASGTGVTSTVNNDRTLTISATSGAVVASLNLASVNTWTGAQTVGTLSVSTAVGFFGASTTGQQASGANLTNNVTAGGGTDVIADYTDLAVYANDSAAIRNNFYQLARKLKQVNDALRVYGLLT